MKKFIILTVLVLCGLSFAGLPSRLPTSVPATTDNSTTITPSTDLASTLTAAGAKATATNPQTVVLSPGTYTVSAALSMASYTRLYGMPGAKIKLANTTNTSIIANSDQTNGNTDIIVEGIEFDGNRSNQTTGSDHGISFVKVTDFAIRDCRFANIKTDAIYSTDCNRFSIDGVYDVNSRHASVNLKRDHYWNLTNCLINNVHYGIYIEDCNNGLVSNLEIYNFRKQGLALVYVATENRFIEFNNLNIHDGARIPAVTDCNYTESGTTYTVNKSAGSFSGFEVGDVVWIGETVNGQITDAEHTIGSINANSSSLTLTTDPGSESLGDVIISLQPFCAHVIRSDDITFNNMTINDGYGGGFFLDGVTTGGASCDKVSFNNCNFINNPVGYNSYGGLYCLSTNYLNISNCKFSDNAGIFGLQLVLCNKVAVSNCTANNNSGTAATGFMVNAVTDAIFTNCIGSNNAQSGMYLQGASDKVLVSNCRFMNTDGGTAQNYGVLVAGVTVGGSVRVQNCNLGNNNDGAYSDASATVPQWYNNNLGALTKITTYSLTNADRGYRIVNTGDTNGSVLTMPQAFAGMGPFYISVVAAQSVIIDPGNAADSFSVAVTGVQQTANKHISCSTAGAYIVLQCFTDAHWSCVDVSGTWAVEE